MKEEQHENVLLICGCRDEAPLILEQLYEAGFSVVGPAPTAAIALALAAQTGPTIAVVATPPTGRRNTSDLGRELLRTWGIRSWVLERAVADTGEDGALASWNASPERVARIQSALNANQTAQQPDARLTRPAPSRKGFETKASC